MGKPLALVDAHVHFWQPDELEYPWLAALPGLRRAFLPPEHAAAAAGAPLEKLVFVEANCRPQQALAEARWIERLALDERRIAAVVAFVDLTDAAGTGAALDQIADIAIVRGIRHNIQANPPGFALQPAFVAGVRDAGRRGLSFDLCATHDQLWEVVELARRCPGTALVLDHCGKPPIAAGAFEPWRTHIEQLAQLDHVQCKLSGLLTEAGDRRGDDALLPYASHVADAFGGERLMYGSDWPVLTLAGSYGDWYDFTLRFTRAWGESETSAFFHDNAARFYRI